MGDKPTQLETDLILVRDALGELIDDVGGLPPCRERSIVITKLEEAEMWIRRMYDEAADEAQRSVGGTDATG